MQAWVKNGLVCVIGVAISSALCVLMLVTNEPARAQQTTVGGTQFGPATVGGAAIMRSKPAFTSRSSTTTYTADPDLQIPVGPYVYEVNAFLGVDSNATADFKYRIRCPADVCTAAVSCTYATTQADGAVGNATLRHTVGSLSGTPLNGQIDFGSTTTIYVDCHGRMNTLGNATTLMLEWAQQTSDATPIRVSGNSWMSVRRIL